MKAANYAKLLELYLKLSEIADDATLSLEAAKERNPKGKVADVLGKVLKHCNRALKALDDIDVSAVNALPLFKAGDIVVLKDGGTGVVCELTTDDECDENECATCEDTAADEVADGDGDDEAPVEETPVAEAEEAREDEPTQTTI